MSKFSVKKPFTVLVAVVIIIVLGVVAFDNMTPDLLPSLDLPYVLLTTTYPGASPEKVEREVTKPLEQVMATLENIDQVTSSSRSNYSMIILQFTDDANLDTATVDILQKIERVSGGWADTVGTPIITKINPDMLPITVAAVSRDGMNTVELSAFVEETLLPKLEGTAGVADISASGLIEQTVTVTFDEQKIDKLNGKLKKAVDRKLAEAADGLNEAKDQVEEGSAAVESGKDALQSGQQAAADGFGDAAGQISEKQAELNDAKTALTVQIASLKNQLVSLETTRSQLGAIQEKLDDLLAQKAELDAETAALQEMTDTLASLTAARLAQEAQIAAARADLTKTEEEREAAVAAITESDDYKQTEAGFAVLDAQLAARGLTREKLPLTMAAKSTASAAADAALSALDATLAELDVSREDLPAALQELDDGKEKIEDGIAMLETTLEGLSAGQIQLDAAKAQLESQKTMTTLQLSQPTAQLLDSEVQLQSAKTQLEEGEKALEDNRKTAYDAADARQVLTMETLKTILTAQNFSMPAGYAEEDGVRTLVSVGDTVSSQDELADMALIDLKLDGIDPIRLSDVATVELTDNRDEVYTRINGESGVILTFSKQSTYATATVSDNVQERFDKLAAEYDGLAFTTLMSQGDYIHLIVNSILKNLLFSALLSVAILFLFLRDLKPTLITLCSIPLSVLFAIVLMYFSGVTLNMISLSALTVSIGMLVDNSVVVIENTYRLRHQGASALQAAVSGATQVAGAILASTLTTVCVFLPIVFIQGLTRQLFTDMALTVTYALGASLLVALTLVPAMSSRLLKNTKERSHKLFDRFLNGYRRSLEWALRFKPVVLSAAVVLLVLSVVIVLLRGFAYMPDMSATQVTVTVTTEKNTPEEQTRAITDEAAARIQKMDGVETVGAMMSGGTMMSLLSGGSGGATMYVMLRDDAHIKTTDLAAQIEEACADLDAEITASGTSMMSASVLSGSGVEIHVYANDLQTLQQTAKGIAEVLETVEGVQNVSNGIEDTDPEWHFVVDKEKAAAKGLTVAQVYAEVAAALQNTADATTLSQDGRDITVQIVDGQAMTPDELLEHIFTVTDRNGDKTEVRLQDIATLEKTETLQAINREDQRRYLAVTAEIADGYNVTLVTAAVEKALADYSLPADAAIEFDGENEAIMEALWQMTKMLLLGVLFVYLVMVAQFQSLRSPFIVMFTIPLAFTGGLLGLFIIGKEISVISLIGFVMLSGIIVNNGIVLVDYINQLRQSGVAKKEALLQAGTTRMRPILMTTITTVLGLLTTALGADTGSELMQPIAVVCIGGLVYATLMTLYVVPVMYDLFHRKEMKVITDEDLTEANE
ncbi:MAG: efflux RND transporter permease subunit [Clostridia bacterium]|nr:efflux RND transporter permease subunit [Clostridia bacterium]